MRSCWQIRQGLVHGNGHSKPADLPAETAWMVECAECGLYGHQISCWEQCGGSSCCCAPIHVTCDFCTLYLEHRREIAEMLHANAIFLPNPGTSAASPMAARPPIQVKGEDSAIMEKLQLNIPDLWADHHVLKVRAALTALPGVQDVVASAAFRMVALSYDPAITSPGAIMAELEEAGYPVATDGTGIVTERVPVADGKRDPAWTRLGMRQIKTDERDLKTKR